MHRTLAQETRFFRIAGPAATGITAFRSDGTLVWTNGQPGTTYVIQTVASLPGAWVDYVQLPAHQVINTNQIVAFNPPAGMSFIPAGSFTMGDTLDGEHDAVPTNVYVSGFYMDNNLVSCSRWQAVYDWATNYGYSFANAGAGKALNHPVHTVDWGDCVKWCQLCRGDAVEALLWRRGNPAATTEQQAEQNWGEVSQHPLCLRHGLSVVAQNLHVLILKSPRNVKAPENQALRMVEAAGVEPASLTELPAATTCLARREFSTG